MNGKIESVKPKPEIKIGCFYEVWDEYHRNKSIVLTLGFFKIDQFNDFGAERLFYFYVRYYCFGRKQIISSTKGYFSYKAKEVVLL